MFWTCLQSLINSKVEVEGHAQHNGGIKALYSTKSNSFTKLPAKASKSFTRYAFPYESVYSLMLIKTLLFLIKNLCFLSKLFLVLNLRHLLVQGWATSFITGIILIFISRRWPAQSPVIIKNMAFCINVPDF